MMPKITAAMKAKESVAPIAVMALVVFIRGLLLRAAFNSPLHYLTDRHYEQ